MSKLAATNPNNLSYSVLESSFRQTSDQSMILFLLLSPSIFAISIPRLGGIPVPGRSVPVLRLFDSYAATCRPRNRDDFGMDQLAELMSTLRADEVAQKVYSSLFHSMTDFRVETAMGRWYRVADSKSLHGDDCGVFDFTLLSKADYDATFSSTEHVQKGEQIVSYHGFGRMKGPDPGETLLTTGHPADQCPYFPVKLGGLNLKGEYEYMIWSTPLKYPTMVLARDHEQFKKKWLKEVGEWTERHGFVSPMAALNTRLFFSKPGACRQAYSYSQY